jgi:uncharacterized protein
MTREEALKILSAALPGLRERYGVSDLCVFGSTARNEAGPSSDVDVLVSFEDRAHFRAFMGLQFELEALLGYKVDLVSAKALKPLLRKEVERDLIHVA